MNSKIRIVVTHGVDVTKSFDIIENQRLIVGRGARSDTKLTDPALSRVHFSIEYINGQILISDLGSLTGTFLNGLRIDRNTEADSGDELMAGNSKFLVSMVGKVDADTIDSVACSMLGTLNGFIGETVGGYLLKKVIGVGRTGLVFEAIDIEKQRDAAVKVFSTEFTNEKKYRESFVQGARAFSKISDPNLIRFYKAGKTSNGHFYLAMQLVEGENLEALIQRAGIKGMLDWKEVWQCAFQIGSALHATFDRQVIHRNLIPRNIIRRFSDHCYLLGDFTLAATVNPIMQQYRNSDLVGELQYLPPERVRAASDQLHNNPKNADRIEAIDIRSDIFGLGATCYALLTGKPPASGIDVPDLLDNIRDETPELPTTFHLSVNDQFQSTVMKMLAKDPSERFQTPQELLKELGRIGRLSGLSC